MPEIERATLPYVSELLSALRVVIINGPRQAGKTTLLGQLRRRHGGDFRSLDERQMLDGALRDPAAFLHSATRPLIIDEVQRGGNDLVLAIKYAVDRDPAPGQFVLAGSTRFLTVPTLSESLAGRAAIVELWPFATAELTGAPPTFCDLLFSEPATLATTPESDWTRAGYLDHACLGGYPSVLRIESPRARRAWFDGYLTTIVARDIVEFAQVQHAELLPRLLGLIAARAGGGAVLADLSRSVGVTEKTARNYLSYLESVFLTARLPAWSTNLTSKLAKTQKLFLTDSGLQAHLMQVSPETFQNPAHPALGGLIETFVFAELTRLRTLSETRFGMYYFRDRAGREVDFILETTDGRVVAIEVKASSSPSAGDARNLYWLRDLLGERCVAAVLLHLGRSATSFGRGVVALPISAMWAGTPLPRLPPSSPRPLSA